MGPKNERPAAQSFEDVSRDLDRRAVKMLRSAIDRMTPEMRDRVKMAEGDVRDLLQKYGKEAGAYAIALVSAELEL